MLEAGHGESSGQVDTCSSDPERGTRRQYTVKGIENETVALMRDAAKKEGMKIGSWISARMKEAAEKALAEMPKEASDRKIQALHNRPVPDTKAMIEEIFLLLNSYRDTSENRLSSIERELHEITSAQRTIMSQIISNR